MSQRIKKEIISNIIMAIEIIVTVFILSFISSLKK